MMRPKKGAPDFLLFITVLMLLSIGVIMVLSASEYSTLVRYHDSFLFFKRQLVWAVLGLTAMFVAMNFDYWRLKQYAGWMLVGAFLLLLLVLIPGVGVESHGARRWIGVGSFTFQPSELVKLCVITFTAFGLAKKRDQIRSFTKGVLPFLIVAGLAGGLILLQPDLGTAMTLVGTVFLMLFAAGTPMRVLGSLGIIGVALVGAAIYFEPYRLKRLLAFLDPWQDPQGSGFHIIQSLYALGSGGLFGTGLGQGKQKFLYLPEQHTDFIFAVIGEELGFVGATLIIILFMLFVWRGLRIAVASPDPFASLLATGITGGIVLQAIINIGVVTGSLPVTGITLPFISFGGTSLLFTLIGVGILLNVSKYAVNR
ncbi:stage V sporulation protein E [Desulforudis sp. 1031]|uniref:stage V sporulation protein E n=2 Tax=Candidatus Desulforudis TaxID=471826 RepID=UPI003CFA5DB7